MSTTQTRTQITTSPWTAKGVAVAAVRLLLDWQERASQRHHLSGLDDNSLKDIGLSRSDVEFEATKPFWRA